MPLGELIRVMMEARVGVDMSENTTHICLGVLVIVYFFLYIDQLLSCIVGSNILVLIICSFAILRTKYF